MASVAKENINRGGRSANQNISPRTAANRQKHTRFDWKQGADDSIGEETSSTRNAMCMHAGNDPFPSAQRHSIARRPARPPHLRLLVVQQFQRRRARVVRFDA
jgi:hypothetical protein